MCPPWPPPKTMGQILMEAAVECARRNPELWLRPRPNIDDLDYAGV